MDKEKLLEKVQRMIIAVASDLQHKLEKGLVYDQNMVDDLLCAMSDLRIANELLEDVANEITLKLEDKNG